jgi:thiol-disulfide isomerase/thioredoxin
MYFYKKNSLKYVVMKRMLFTVFAILISILGNSQKKDYVTIECKLANQKTDSLFIWGMNSGRNYLVKAIKLNKDGVFKDTLTVKAGTHLISDVRQTMVYNALYLKNGYDLQVAGDFNKWMATVVFNGEGANENIAFLQVPQSFPDINPDSDEPTFKSELEKAKKVSLALIEGKNFDSAFYEETKNQIIVYYDRIEKNRKNLIYKNKLNNTASPSFDFINYLGGKSKLEDFKGKYVYIDVWATWCGPCLRELPHLKKIEELYHGKDIVFVSISTDELKDLEKWKKMIATKSMSGIQLLEDDSLGSLFSKHYKVTSIPRFILIDPKGVVVASDAPRPSDPLLKEKLDALLN